MQTALPIETAPKKFGEVILLYSHGDWRIGFWVASKEYTGWTAGWLTNSGYDVGWDEISNPTYWAPLPTIPETE